MTIYLDNNATTAMDPTVLRAVTEACGDAWGNPSSVHAVARATRERFETARRTLAEDLGLDDPARIVWTSSGTEANTTVLWGCARFFQGQKNSQKNRVIISAGEHSSVLKNARALASVMNIDVVAVPLLPNGLPDLAFLAQAINEQTFLVSIMTANNETGLVFPFQKVGALCRDREVLFHTDAVNALGKIPLDLSTFHFDFLSLSSHKIHGPKGVGALILGADQNKFQPLLYGGGQERGRRSGTENVPGVVGFAKAYRVFRQNEARFLAQMCTLRDRYEELVTEQLDGVRCVGQAELRTANTSSMVVEGVTAQSLLIALDLEGVCLSAGSACASGSLEPSHVYAAMGCSRTEAGSAVRMSLSHFTTEDEIRQAATIFVRVVKRIRSSVEKRKDHVSSTSH